MWSAVCWHKSMFQRVPVTSVLDDSFGPNNNNGVLFLFRSVFFAEDFLGVAVLFFSNSNSNSKRCGSLSLGTFFFIIKDIVVSNRNDLLADLERQQEQPQKEKHWTNTQPHLRNSCSSVARRRSIAPTLGTRRSLRKQALIKRGTRVDSHLRATDIPPKTKKKTGDYPPPLHCKKRERERDQRKVAHGRAWEDEDDAGLVRDLSVDAAFDSWRRFFASLHKNDGVWGVGVVLQLSKDIWKILVQRSSSTLSYWARPRPFFLPKFECNKTIYFMASSSALTVEGAVLLQPPPLRVFFQ